MAERRVRRVRQTESTPAKPTMDRQSATGRLRAIPLGEGVPPLPELYDELAEMTDVLLGRGPAPLDAGHITLLEVADAYFARASEITMLLQQAEQEGTVIKGSAHYRFRTGPLRTFMEMARQAAQLGSRRLTAEQLWFEMQRTGREYPGGS